MTVKLFLAVAIGGAFGSMGRYLIALQTVRLWGTNFPWGTFTVNVLGSFIMGIIFCFASLKWQLSEEMKNFIMVGFLGGFTTFSSFSLDFMKLMDKNQTAEAMLYAGGSLVLGFVAVFLGFYMVKWWFA